jgi:hypothetical protein
MPVAVKALLEKTRSNTTKEDQTFPVSHISASSMIKFSTNPILYKVL